MDKIKTYKQLPIPKDSFWDRKTYNPYTLFRWWLYNLLDKFIFTPIHNCDNGFRNLYKWFKPIWNDRNYDDYYIFEILKQKLILQREYLVSKNRHLNIPQTNRDITICLNLIERFQESYYELEYFDYHESNRYFKPTGEKFEGEDTFTWESDLISENFDEYFKKYKSSYNKLLKNGYGPVKINTFDDKETIALWLGHYNHERCKKLLFKILSERIECWWD